MKRYEIVADGRGIRCLDCGHTSYHPAHLQNRYCSNCEIFHRTFLDELRKELKAAGHTQPEVARWLHIGQPSVSKLLTDKIWMSAQKLHTIFTNANFSDETCAHLLEMKLRKCADLAYNKFLNEMIALDQEQNDAE